MSAASSKGPVFDPGLCRCCGTMRKCRLLNLEYFGTSGEVEVYSDMFMDCFSILLSYLDGKPTERLICAVCVRRLRDAVAFRKQVLECEEAFLQVRMSENDIQSEVKEPKTDQLSPAEGKSDQSLSAMVEIEIVKDEVHSSPSSPATHDEFITCEALDSVKSSVEPPPAPYPSHSQAKLITASKKKVPMSKKQQMIRERDTSYKLLTNVLTIIEYSYACPFRCRHNNLLCYYCGERFMDPQVLREHTINAHNPKKFKVTVQKYVIKVDITRIDCRLCAEKIDNVDEFKKHISEVHNKPYYFDHKDSILPFKLDKSEFKCALCSESFPYFHALNKHMNDHFSNYVCETCGLGFVDIGRFLMHQHRHEDADYPCPECGKNFKKQYNRELHIDRVHKKKGRVYCPKCDIMLMSYHQKLKHLVEVHGDEPISFPCSLCDKVLHSRRALTIHKRKDHFKDYRYQCQWCGQKFFTRFALNNHMPTHTGERNFKCKVCDKAYPRLKTLNEHTRIHTNDRRYRCHVCGQAFIQNCSLKGHMKSQHPEYG